MLEIENILMEDMEIEITTKGGLLLGLYLRK